MNTSPPPLTGCTGETAGLDPGAHYDSRVGDDLADLLKDRGLARRCGWRVEGQGNTIHRGVLQDGARD
jgi:hypothetical protein